MTQQLDTPGQQQAPYVPQQPGPTTAPQPGPYYPAAYQPSSYPPPAPPAPRSAPPRTPQPSYGPPAPPQQPAFPQPPGYGPFPPAPPQRRRTGLIVGLVLGVLVLAGLAIGAVLLFGGKTLDTAAAEKQIAQLTENQIGVAATDVSCPSDIAVKTGGTFTCTGSVDGQPVEFTGRMTDDQGNVHIAATTDFVLVSKVVDAVEQQVAEQTGVEVTAQCQTGGKKVVVDGVGKPISCKVTNNADPTDTLDVSATVDDDGDVTVTG